jgi:Amt family ammonium transporter
MIVGVFGAAIPWLTMNKLTGRWPFRQVDDTLGVIHTHFTAGAVGGLLVGFIANPAMTVYLGEGGASVSVRGLLAGNAHQLLIQVIGLLVVTAYAGGMTFVILKAISVVVPIRMSDLELEHGDRVLFDEEVFELHHPIPPPEPIHPPDPHPSPAT